MPFKFKTITVAANPGLPALPLHDGTNGDPLGGHKTVAGFIIEPISADVFFGEADLDVAGTKGLTFKRRESTSMDSFDSRGTPQHYDLSEIYYIGGSFKITIEIKA